MNLRLGRFGLQESACAVGLGALISGIFAVDVRDTFAQGNLCYVATAAGALLSLLLLMLLGQAMARFQAEDLGGLLLDGFGPILGAALGLPLVLGLVLAAGLPLFRFSLAMERYIFVEADYVPIVLYLLPVLLLLVLSGMETVARMAKILLIPGAVALITTLLLASPAFDSAHLFPLFSPGFSAFVDQTGEALFRFLPPGVALFIAGRGCQGRANTLSGVSRGLLLGGAGAFLLHLGLGLTFFAPDMASLSAPVYCMTMAARQERMALRLDVLALFLWVATGLVVAAFYTYAAALLLCRLLDVKDVRPVGALLVLQVVGAVLLFNFDSDMILDLVRRVYRQGHLLLLLPLGPLVVRSLLQRRRP